jgi:hypothetical protein
MGRLLDETTVKMGLRELCPDIHFDMATNLNGWHPSQSLRQGVFWHGQHVCSMDRGMIPEFKQWTVITKYVPVGWEEADKEDVSISTQVIPMTSEEYRDALLHVMAKDTGYEWRPDGAIIRYTPMAYRKVQGRVAMVGWRHTFERIINRNLPGLTRSAIASKFGVDMLKFPVGTPQEMVAALLEE